MSTTPPTTAHPMPSVAGPRRRWWVWLTVGGVIALVLVPILVVVSLVLINIVAAGSRVDAARAAVTQSQLTVLKSSVLIYEGDHQSFPPSLAALAPRYVSLVPLDGWQRPFHYAVPGPGGAPYELVSVGLDGILGTADDIRVPPVPPLTPASSATPSAPVTPPPPRP